MISTGVGSRVVAACLVALAAGAARSSAGAQDTRMLRDSVRAISRGVEGGKEATLRTQVTARGAAPLRDLQLATLDRLAFRRQESEAVYRALWQRAIPAVRAHAAYGLASLFAQSSRYGDAAIWFDSAGASFAALGDSIGQAESLVGTGQAIVRTKGAAAARAAVARAHVLAPASDTWVQAQIACVSVALRVRAADSVTIADFTHARRLAHGISARTEAQCLLAQVELLETRGERESALATLDTLTQLQVEASLLSGLSASRQWQGWILLTSGEYVTSRRRLEEAVELGQRSGTLNSAGWANQALGELAQRVGSWVDAARYSRRAQRAFTDANDQAGLASARMQSASLALATGDLARASQGFADVQGDVLAAVPRSIVEVLSARTDIARRMGNLERSRVLLDSAELFARRQDLPGWDSELRYRRAMLAMAHGRFDEARTTLTAMVAARTPQSPLLSYQLLARLAEVEARTNRIPQAQQQLEAALEQLDLWRRGVADRGFRLAASQTRGFDWDTDLGVATVIAAIASRGDANTALALADKRRARVLLDEAVRRKLLAGAPNGGAIAERVAHDEPNRVAIPEGTAVIAYTTGNGGEPTTMIVMTSERTTAIVTTAADSLTDLTRRFVAFLEAGTLPRVASRRLAASLIDPALPHLPKSVKRLIIVPDGSIHRVPFSALVLANDSLLAQRFEVVTAPSVGIAVDGLSRTAGSNRGGVLAFGAPSGLSAADAEWPPLPGARDEMRNVARLVAGTEIIEGERATLTSLREAASRAGSVLHLATHARAIEYSLLSGAMLFAPEGEGTGEATAPEIAAMSLPFDLVVLSACESGNGSLFTGEGLQGLATAFLEAGSRSVLATRWRLEDRDGEMILEVFYRSLSNGRDAAGALADARRLAIERKISPAVWANFEFIGDPNAAPKLHAAESWSEEAIAMSGLAMLCALLYGARFVVNRMTL